MKTPLYTAVNASLGAGDNRKAHVTGPDLNGRISPVASFWTFEEAQAWAKEVAFEAIRIFECFMEYLGSFTDEKLRGMM